MLTPESALALMQTALNDPRINFVFKRYNLCADANLLDAVPKVDGFFSLTPYDFDQLLSMIYTVTNYNYSRLEDFLGVSQTNTPDFHWQARAGFLPLVTAGQKPIFLDVTNTYWAFERNDYDPAKVVFLPPEAKTFVTASNLTAAKILQPKFGNNSVDFQTETDLPSLAVIAQTYYHNWRAEIDGQPAPLLRANNAFQAVPVPAGTHKIHIFYRDRAFEIGAAISVCMWVNCLVSYLALRRRELPPAPAPANGDYF
jgi:hypothetical protein